MKPIIIRRAACGHWKIFTCLEIDDIIYFHSIAHLDTFSDVLLLINGEAELVYV